MYNCPNCSGNLSFDIESQMLMCEYCKTKLDPYEYQKTQDAEERDDFGVTVFTCPQCGGEVMTTNVTAAGFCMYCGASTILDSRMSKEKRPKHIIPFTQTKKDCQKAYSHLVKRALFAPGEFRDPQFLDRFRGIYMPYWIYDLKLRGTLRLKGEHSYRRGDYKITDHYRLSGEVDASYEGLNYDASSSFDDTVASCIAPFKADTFKPFTPSMLCGFYADSPDVDSSVYSDSLQEMLYDDTIDRISGVPEFRDKGMQAPGEKKLENIGLRMESEKPECAFLPVWFLTYRKGDRVAYAVMNGSTGKITADLPVDEKKYVFGSLLLALPIFAVLALLFTITGHAALMCSSITALVSLALYMVGVSEISDKDSRANDIGYRFTKDPSGNVFRHNGADNLGKTGSSGISGYWKLIPLVLALILIGLKPAMAFLTDEGTITFYTIYGVISMLLLIAVIALIETMAETEMAKKGIFLHTLGSLIAVIISAVILVFNPVSDLWFYGGSILSAIGVMLTLIGMIRKYNILATRPLPTFYDRKGGNDSAN